MHGGSATVLEADEEEGEVFIGLIGACSGCGISPMTVTAIRKRIRDEMDSVERVEVSTGASFEQGESSSSEDTNDKESGVQAPF